MAGKRRLVKAGISTSLGILALTAAGIRGGFHGWFAAGMAVCWLGDMILSRVPPFAGPPFADRTGSPLAGGMAAFFAGHLCYAAGLAVGAVRAGMRVRVLAVCLPLLILPEAVLFLTAVRPGPAAAPLKGAGAAYIAMVCVNAALGLALAVGDRVLWPLAAGGLLFLVSDTLIGLRELGGRRVPGGEWAVWATYAPAQALILIGSLFLK